jgi:hypothetical protein
MRQESWVSINEIIKIYFHSTALNFHSSWARSRLGLSSPAGNVVTCRPIPRERVDKHIFMEVDSWKPARCGTHFHGYEWSRNVSLDADVLCKRPFRSEEISRKSDVSRSSARNGANQNGASPRRSFIVSYCNWLFLWEILQEGVNKSNHPIQNPVIVSHAAITRDSINI